MITPQDKQAFGEAGCVYETGTSTVTGDFCALQCLTNTVFSAITNTIGSGDAITSLTLPAGTVLYGKFTTFTLTSGAVCAYNSAQRA